MMYQFPGVSLLVGRSPHQMAILHVAFHCPRLPMPPATNDRARYHRVCSASGAPRSVKAWQRNGGATSDFTTELYPRAMTQCACSSESDCDPSLPQLALGPCTNCMSDPWRFPLSRICFWTVFSQPLTGGCHPVCPQLRAQTSRFGPLARPSGLGARVSNSASFSCALT